MRYGQWPLLIKAALALLAMPCKGLADRAALHVGVALRRVWPDFNGTLVESVALKLQTAKILSLEQVLYYPKCSTKQFSINRH